ncbi:uncharacterized protein [Tursiops truncatus]|uniref:uncharacterized protein isoform X2 n=1 Tax=Tursiops truncatus TaxID=9739 RepID=UPI003CCF7657
MDQSLRFRPEARLGNLSTTRCSSGPHTWLAQQAQQMSNKCVYRFRGAPAVADLKSLLPRGCQSVNKEGNCKTCCSSPTPGESSFLGVWHRCIQFFTKEPTILTDHPPADLGAENQSIFFSKTEGVLEGRKQPCTLCRVLRLQLKETLGNSLNMKLHGHFGTEEADSDELSLPDCSSASG